MVGLRAGFSRVLSKPWGPMQDRTGGGGTKTATREASKAEKTGLYLQDDKGTHSQCRGIKKSLGQEAGHREHMEL